MAIMIQDKILNNFPVRKSDHRTGDADTSICVRFLSITINPQQSKKTIPILSIQGNPGQRNFSKREKIKVPKAAAKLHWLWLCDKRNLQGKLLMHPD